MDDGGNILVRRYSRSNVYVKTTTPNGVHDDSVLGNEVLKSANNSIDYDKIVKVRFAN